METLFRTILMKRHSNDVWSVGAILARKTPPRCARDGRQQTSLLEKEENTATMIKHLHELMHLLTFSQSNTRQMRHILLLSVILYHLGVVVCFGLRPGSTYKPSKSAVDARRSLLSATSLAEEEASSLQINGSENEPQRRSTGKVAILVCPAQFCVPDDYQVLFENLSKVKEQVDVSVIGTCKVAPLPRNEWIKVARQLPTQEFFNAELPVYKTLKWYFDAIEKAASDIFAQEGPDVSLCIVGHSIGGWVARAYLGGLSRSSTAVHRRIMAQCSSLITLGTPHVSPEDALVDQTRGLLREIEETDTCQPEALADRGIDITCVCSQSLSGKFTTLDIEEVVAASSYLPLLGRVGEDVKGDGIVPLDLAFMGEPSRRVIVDRCSVSNAPVRHSHVLPTPWNLWDGYAPSINLPEDYVSYVSEGVLCQWAPYIR